MEERENVLSFRDSWRVSDKDQERAFKLYLNGASYAEVARTFKVAHKTIIRWAKKFNWPARKAAIEHAQRAVIVHAEVFDKCGDPQEGIIDGILLQKEILIECRRHLRGQGTVAPKNLQLIANSAKTAGTMLPVLYKMLGVDTEILYEMPELPGDREETNLQSEAI